MAQLAQRVHANRRRPEAAARRPPTAEAQRSRTIAKPQAHLAAPVAAAVTERVSQAVAARTHDAGPAHPLGLPPRLRSGVEALSGLAMDDVRVHRNSAEPAKLGALAYAKGSDIHLAPGQDRHLPHEAWHVVQQKQGRVTATTQMKGVGLNEDAVLEAEADNMGSVAEHGSPVPVSSELRDRPAPATAIQRKIFSVGGWLEALPEYSPVTLKFIKEPTRYQMRDSSCPTDKTIEILDMSKKYLLGEEHDSGKWEKDTDFWSMDKMREGGKVIPHEPGDKLGIFDEKVEPFEQPLESVHAYLLRSAMGAFDLLGELPTSSTQADISANSLLALSAVKIRQELDQVSIVYDNHYSDFSKAFDEKYKPLLLDKATKIQKKPDRRLQLIYNLAKDLKGYLAGSLKNLTDKAIVLDDQMTNQVIMKTNGIPPNVSIINSALTALRVSNRSALLNISRQLVSILSSGDKAVDEGMRSLLETTRTPNFGEIIDKIDPVREIYMADNIRQARAPLLVQIGNDHLEPVAGKVGRDVAVAVDKKVPLSKIATEPKSEVGTPKNEAGKPKQGGK